jgi:hypothetical protein
MTFYLGKVTKILDDNATIEVTIPNVTENTFTILAYPIVALSRVAVIDDEVMILQIDDNIPLYYYFVTPIDDYTKEVVLRYKDVKIGIDTNADNKNGMVNIIKTIDGKSYTLSSLIDQLIQSLITFRTTGSSSAQFTEQSKVKELKEILEYANKFIGGFV